MSTEKTHLCGAVPSPYDSRDWVYEALPNIKAGEAPAELDLRNAIPNIRDQGSQGSCVAMSGACMKEWQEYHDEKISGYYSPQFIYNQRENQSTEGMYLRDLMKILTNKGCCREGFYPYGSKEDIPQNAFEDAKNFVIKGYAKIFTIDGLKQALVKNGPCVITYPVYNYTSRFWKQRSGDKSIGGHAVAVVGYDANGFLIRNSWGDDWANKGYTVYPYGDWGAHWEVYTTVDADSMPPGPEPDNDKKKKKKCKCVLF